MQVVWMLDCHLGSLKSQLIDDIKDGDCKNLPDKSQIKKLQDKLESEISKIVVEQR